MAREAAKLTKSAVVAQPIAFKRTAPGYENATTGFTTCWEGNDWVRELCRLFVADAYSILVPLQSINFLNMN